MSAQLHDQSVKVGEFDAAALQLDQAVAPKPNGDPVKRLVSCGPPVDGLELKIVDRSTRRPCVDGTVGEIWIQGPSVARGYWANPVITAANFRRRMEAGGAGSYLGTGDLGFVLEGELYVTGRQKDLIVVSGRNHYPQDLELTARESHPALIGAMGAAFSIMGDRGEELVLVHEVDMAYRGVDGAEVVTAMRQAVAEQHELAVEHFALVQFASLPKTSSGKIRRRRCCELFLAGALKAQFASPAQNHGVSDLRSYSTARESGLSDSELDRLHHLVAGVLEISPGSLDPNRPLTQQGLSSLRATELQCQLEESFNVTILAEDFFEPWTVLRIGELIAARSKSRSADSGRTE